MHTTKPQIEKAMRNPKEAFASPEKVLADPDLDRAKKREILKSWEQDERELAVAEEEGMTGGEHDMLQRVQRALKQVSDEPADEGKTTTKHG